MPSSASTKFILTSSPTRSLRPTGSAQFPSGGCLRLLCENWYSVESVFFRVSGFDKPCFVGLHLKFGETYCHICLVCELLRDHFVARGCGQMGLEVLGSAPGPSKLFNENMTF